MNAYRVQIRDRLIYLVDSPGFDDTQRNDAEILSEVAYSLSDIYARGMRLLGILYLYRITDIRVSGASLKSLEILQKLCGEAQFKGITVVTTMWQQQEQAADGAKKGEEREQDLQRIFFAPLVQHGAQFRRHYDTRDSAEDIVAELVLRNETFVLDLQRQMVEKQLSLDQTTVGQFVQKELKEQQLRYEREIQDLEGQLREAQARKDDSVILDLREELQCQRRLQAQLQKDRRSLGANLTQIFEKRNPEYALHDRLSKKTPAEQPKMVIHQNQLAKLEEQSRRQELTLNRLQTEQDNLKEAFAKRQQIQQMQQMRQMQQMQQTQQQQRMSERRMGEEAGEQPRNERKRRQRNRDEQSLFQSVVIASTNWCNERFSEGAQLLQQSLLSVQRDSRVDHPNEVEDDQYYYTEGGTSYQGRRIDRRRRGQIG